MGEEDARLRRNVTSNGPVAIRDAATVILVRDAESEPRLLMGQRGRNAAFMPEKFVFPGGAVDVSDTAGEIPRLNPVCERRLSFESKSPDGALASAALRELREETGQRLTDARALSFFFRAVTPVGPPRRFDARFFLADASRLETDPDDFSDADQELGHLSWVALADARSLDLPFITEIVLGELEAHLPRLDPPDRVGYVRDDDFVRGVTWL